MSGRYGPDQLNMALIVLGLILGIAADIAQTAFLSMLSYIVLVYVIFRFLSRNIAKRRRENDRFLRYWWPVRQKLKLQRDKFKLRKTYKFFTCPSCKETLRLPKGKGKIQITCPKCGERFVKKT